VFPRADGRADRRPSLGSGGVRSETAAEVNVLTGLDQVGMVDEYRTVNGYGEFDGLDVSHPTSSEDPIRGKRFDHSIASRELDPNECYYDRSGLECSDHAPMIATFSPDL